MELVKHKSEDEFIDLVISSLKPSSNSLSRISDTNRQSLKGLVKYLSKLKKENVIEAEQFSELITIACANFIENEVEIRLSKSIDKKNNGSVRQNLIKMANPKKNIEKKPTESHTEESKEEIKGKISEAEILESMPDEVRKVMEMGFSMQRISGPAPNPLHSKINESHIDKILDITAKDDENTFNDAQSSKKFGLTYFILILIFICFLIWFLIDKDQELLMSIIERGLFIICGFGGGYGYKAYRDNKKNI